MPRTLRTLASLALVLLLAAPAWAQQEVTVREINDIPDANIQALIDGGTSLSEDQIIDLIEVPLNGQEVLVTVVLLTSPFNSGLATFGTDTDGDGEPDAPSRTHSYVRDITAATAGFEGMTIQVVDGVNDGLLITNYGVGDVLEIVGRVAPFGTVMQISPISIEKVDELGPDDPLLQPVVITSTADINSVIAAGSEQFAQINWNNFESLRGQYVRLEGVTVTARDISSDRPNFQVSSAGTDAYTNLYDTSLRYRNDRAGDYPSPPWNTRPADEDFVPPPPGSVANIQGFLVYNGFDAFNQSVPADAVLNIVPWEDTDLEVTETPPVIVINPLSFVPGNAPVTVESEIFPDPTRTLASATLSYRFLPDADFTEVALTAAGDTYSAEIPAPADGTFVEYFLTAADDTGATSVSNTRAYRVLYDGINSVEDIQINATEGPGASPFAGIVTAMDIQAVVTSNPTVSGQLTIQDDEGLAPWTGIFVEYTEAISALNLQPGDRVSISEAEVVEQFDVTRLDDATLERTGTGTPYGYKEVPTGVLAQDPATAEAHEGIALRFLDVEITEVDAGFGEWQFSSDGSEDNQVRADNQSGDIAEDFNVNTFTQGETRAFIQGLWWFSFGDYKLIPETASDIGTVVSNEADGTPQVFALDGAYPNPLRGQASVRFSLDRAGDASVRVYDVTGRLVATLFDGEAAPQQYDVAFDASALASGVYVVQLRSEGRVQTQKMIVLR